MYVVVPDRSKVTAPAVATPRGGLPWMLVVTDLPGPRPHARQRCGRPAGSRVCLCYRRPRALGCRSGGSSSSSAAMPAASGNVTGKPPMRANARSAVTTARHSA